MTRGPAPRHQLSPVGSLFNHYGKPSREVLGKEDMQQFMSSIAKQKYAAQRQECLQQWLDNYSVKYSDFLLTVTDPALLLTRLKEYLEQQMPSSSNPRDDVTSGYSGATEDPADGARPAFWTSEGTPSPHIWTPEDEASYYRLVLRSPDQTRAQISFWTRWNIRHARDLELFQDVEIVSTRVRDWVYDNVVLASAKDPGTSTAPMEH